MSDRSPRILKLFLDVHMGLGHDGLALIARTAKVKLENLASEDLLMFLNRAGDKMKVLGAQGQVLGYLKMPKHRRIMKEALQYIPHTFGASGFDYDKACKIALEKRLGTAVE